MDKRVETAKSQSLICPPTNLFLSSLDDRNIIAQTGMVYHLCANQDLILIRKIIDLKYKEEIEYDAWVEEIGKANNKIIDKFEHFYVEINRGKQVD